MTFGWAEVIALAALVLSLFTLWLRHRDAGRASFVAAWSRPDEVTAVNVGTGPARDVSVVVASTHSGDRIDSASAGFVPPQQLVTVSIVRTMMVQHGPVDITWRDNRRGEQRVEIALGDPPRSRTRAGPPRGALEEAIRDVAVDAIEDYRAHDGRPSTTWRGVTRD